MFLTTGRTGLAVFAPVDRWFLVRSVDPPEPPVPRRMTVLLDRGPFTLDGERALLREHGIDVLVTKNSGGPRRPSSPRPGSWACRWSWWSGPRCRGGVIAVATVAAAREWVSSGAA